MSHPSDPPAPSRSRSNAPWLLLVVAVCAACVAGGVLWTRGGRNQPAAHAREPIAEPRERAPQQAPEDNRRRFEAPEFEGGVAWLNTAGPLRLKDLRGKIVLLDFWTLCCINCMHVLHDLARLEKKYPNELVVIGVHTAKFQNEKNTESIRKAILRYEITHPVVNDAEQRIWEANPHGIFFRSSSTLARPERARANRHPEADRPPRIDRNNTLPPSAAATEVPAA